MRKQALSQSYIFLGESFETTHLLDVHEHAGVEGQTDKPRPHVHWADVVHMNQAEIQQA